LFTIAVKVFYQNAAHCPRGRSRNRYVQPIPKRAVTISPQQSNIDSVTGIPSCPYSQVGLSIPINVSDSDRVRVWRCCVVLFRKKRTRAVAFVDENRDEVFF